MFMILAESNSRVGVLVQAENAGAAALGLIGAHTFEHAHAVVQRMGEHVHLGIAPGHHFAIKPDQTIAVGHGHNETPADCVSLAH